MPPKKNNTKWLIFTIILIVVGIVLYYFSQIFFGTIKYEQSNNLATKNVVESTQPIDVISDVNQTAEVSSSDLPITHINTPDKVKAVYVSGWVAGNSKYRDPIIKLIDDTELNSIVIDVKDSTGRISFAVSDPEIAKEGSPENRIRDIRSLTNLLHKKNIYIIGRVSVFQDPYMTKKRPEWAITKKSDGTVWKDRKGLSFLDPANKEVWKYIVSIAHDAYAQGFDEINFDYIRYPSDGNMKDINYRLAQGATRSDNIESFFKYLSEEVKKNENIPMSADLFGLTTEATDDMGIGQIWEKALPHFDFIAPMVYPSHYPAGQDGFKNPAEHPYEIINKAMIGAIKKTKLVPNQSINKIRPWLQDFDLGANYNAERVKAQIEAVYDNGLSSWMLWDPSNKYTPGALMLETLQ